MRCLQSLVAPSGSLAHLHLRHRVADRIHLGSTPVVLWPMGLRNSAIALHCTCMVPAHCYHRCGSAAWCCGCHCAAQERVGALLSRSRAHMLFACWMPVGNTLDYAFFSIDVGSWIRLCKAGLDPCSVTRARAALVAGRYRPCTIPQHGGCRPACSLCRAGHWDRSSG